MTDDASPLAGTPLPLSLLEPLRDLIVQARQQVLRHADVVQVQTYWQIGRHIVEFEQGGQARAAYGQGWSTRMLERHIGTLYYERLLSSRDRAALLAEAQAGTEGDSTAGNLPRDFVRDPVMLEFLGLPDTGRLLESNLERALMDKLQQFLLELGKGFAFVGRQQRISTETQDFYIDLVFYNYLLKCFVLIDLKTGHLSHQDIVQMDMYVRLYDDLRRSESDNPTVGILLCGSKDQAVVRYSVLHESEQLFASKYRLVLPSEDELRQELERDHQALMAQAASKK